MSWHKLLGSRIGQVAAAAPVALAFLLLPITSLPALSAAMGGTLVAPPTVALLSLLAAVWLPAYLVRNGTLPQEARPWLFFGGAALLSSLLAFFLAFPAYKGHTLLDAETGALLTFGGAAALYLVLSTWVREPGRLQWALRWINLGGLVLIGWSFAQWFVILFEKGDYPGFMMRVQDLVSLRSLQDHIYYTRLAGLAYEPSWLAHQLNVVYLPLWLAVTITGHSSFKKWGWLSVETALLAAGSLVLVLSYSRVGLLAFLLMLAYGLLRLNLHAVRRLQARLQRRGGRLGVWGSWLLLPILFGAYALLAFGLLTLLARTDARIASLLGFRNASTNLMEMAFRSDLAERLIYWANGLLVLASYPLLGVGLGNAGFFFSQNLHLLGYRSAEILQVLNEAGDLPNIKSLWVRIPAETGLAGFAFFLAGYYLLWRAGQTLTRDPSPALRTMGWMGVFALLSFSVEGFSVDSFALPYLWVSAGLLTAASAMARKAAAQAPRTARGSTRKAGGA